MSEREAGLSGTGRGQELRRIALPLLLILIITSAVAVVAFRRNGRATIPITGDAGQAGPARIEPIENTDFSRVILTERAADRLGIETDTVREVEWDGEIRLVVPYSAIIYGLNGETWAYTSPEALTYVREPIAVHAIAGDDAYLTAGPPVGAAVVTVGVAELYGAETGVGK